MTREIPLTKGLFAIIDDEDYDRVSKRKWHASKVRDKYYAAGYKKVNKGVYKTELLHRFIMNAPDGVQVDHWNGDRLNCTRKNLRLCNNSQNNHNQGVRSNNKSGLRGVDFMKNRGRWRARISIDGKAYHLGLFDTKKEAAQARDIFAKENLGDFVRMNILDSAKSS